MKLCRTVVFSKLMCSYPTRNGRWTAGGRRAVTASCARGTWRRAQTTMGVASRPRSSTEESRAGAGVSEHRRVPSVVRQGS